MAVITKRRGGIGAMLDFGFMLKYSYVIPHLDEEYIRQKEGHIYSPEISPGAS